MQKLFSFGQVLQHIVLVYDPLYWIRSIL